MTRLSYIKKYIKRYKIQIFLAVLFLGLESLTSLIQPFLMAKIIDIGIKNHNIGYIYKLGGLMIGLTILMGLFTIIRNRYSSMASQNIGSDLREDLYIHIQNLKMEDIDKLEISSLLTRITNDVDKVQSYIYSIMRVFLKAPLIGLGSVFMAGIINPKMSIIFLLTIPLVGLLIKFNMKVSYPSFKKIQKSLDRLNIVIREYLSGIRLVKAFNRYGYEKEKFRLANINYMEKNIRGERLVSIFSPLVSLLVNLGIVLIIYFGDISISKGKIQLGEVVALVDYMSQMLFSLVMVNSFISRSLRAGTSGERIGEVFSFDLEDLGGLEGNKLGENLGVEFKDVSFSYESSKVPALNNINFKVYPGERLGIIGPTGSGKTSIVNLLIGFYPPTRGEILIGGLDINRISKSDLRENIGLVSQNNILFKGSIGENISWAKKQASREEVEEVASISEADGFIKSFKSGYETRLGQGGVNLSGGQKQRLSISRGLLRNPKILILDDSFSALDGITENKLMKNLENLKEKPTIILISQNISTVSKMDRILVLEAGELVGLGSHIDLMKTSKVYRDIYKSQIGRDD